MLNPRLTRLSDRGIDRSLAEHPPRQPPALGADDLAVALGFVIYRARFRAGLTQFRLARLLGVDRSIVSRWEAGLRTPTLSHLRALGDLIDRPASDLLVEVEQLLIQASGSTPRPPIPAADQPPVSVPGSIATADEPVTSKPKARLKPKSTPASESIPEPMTPQEPAPEPVPAGGAIWALAGWWRQTGSGDVRSRSSAGRSGSVGRPVGWPGADDGEVASAGD